MILRPTISHPDLSYLFNDAHSQDSGIRLELGRDCGRPVDILEIGGNVTPEHAAKLEETIWQRLPHLRSLRSDQFGDYVDRSEVRHSEPLALTQLLLIYHLLREYSEGEQMLYAPPVAALSRMNLAPATASTESTERVRMSVTSRRTLARLTAEERNVMVAGSAVFGKKQIAAATMNALGETIDVEAQSVAL